jgi:protein-disulfide isomerase
MASRADQKEEAKARRLEAEEADRRQARRRASLMRLGLVLSLAVVAVIVAVLVSSNNGSSDTSGGGTKPGDAAAANALVRGIPQKALVLGGNAKAPTLLEFVDLQCPYCRQYSDDVFPTVVKQYVRSGKIRYQLRVRSFIGPDSQRAAAAAAVATQQNHLFQFVDLFYRRQGEENTGYATDSFIKGIASATGVDASKAVSAANHPGAQPLMKQAEQQANALGSNSTPEFYLRLKGGRVVKVPTQFEPQSFTQGLDKALAQGT